MNYLAHAVLSFNKRDVLVGNMISDFVKGKEQYDYSDGIRKGILIHRAIDTYTDQHPVNREARKIFKDVYGLYSSVFLDIAYDHFVAIDNTLYKSGGLHNFSSETYNTLEAYAGQLPLRFKNILPYMKKQNWLYNYQYEWGIENSFKGIIQRASYITDKTSAIEIFRENYNKLENHYLEFFPQLSEYTQSVFRAQGISLE